jgi:hypothetical protein
LHSFEVQAVCGHDLVAAYISQLVCCAEAALHRGLEGLVWRDDATDAYIRDTLELVRDLDSVLTTLKENVAQIMELLKMFESNHMFDRKVITAPPSS